MGKILSQPLSGKRRRTQDFPHRGFSFFALFAEVVFSHNHGSQNATHGVVAEPVVGGAQLPAAAAATTTASARRPAREFNKD